MEFRAKVARALVYVWAAALTVYLAVDRWNHFRDSELAKSYAAGRTEVIKQVLDNARRCRPFTVSLKDEQAKLIPVDCPQVRLVPPGQQAVSPPPGGPGPTAPSLPPTGPAALPKSPGSASGPEPAPQPGRPATVP